MKKLRVTVVVEYEADPKHYDTDDPAKMALIDAEQWQGTEGVVQLACSFDDDQYVVTVEPIKEEA